MNLKKNSLKNNYRFDLKSKIKIIVIINKFEKTNIITIKEK
jgi:hypothetical protein